MTGSPRLSVRDRAEVEPALSALITAAEDVDGQAPFNEASLLEKTQVVALERDGALVGAAMTGPETELVIHPAARRQGFGGLMLAALLDDDFAAWAHGDHPGARALAARHGLRRARVLLQMRAAVPAHRFGWSRADISLDAFRRGADEEDWLALNARSFASHPEQGSITREGLERRLAENGSENLLVARDADGRMRGFCWLKLDGGLGEIYVLGVDPDLAGRGIGGSLLRAGLDRLAELGITESNLYVEADNEPALRLYRALGYREHAVDVLYRR